jgi:glycosyltransferase involved in cell wall biosynthesis
LHAKREADELKTIINVNDNKYLVKVTPHPTYGAFRFENISKQEARKRLGIAQGEKILLLFGFVRKYKGLTYLLQAMKQIKSSVNDIKLLIVGDFDGDKSDYISQIKELGITENVTIKDGYIPDKEVEPYFAACDLVMLPYISATQSGIAQIAYGFNKAVIATNVGGLPDIVSDGKTGYIVPPKSSEEIAIAVQKFFDEGKQPVFEENIKNESYRFSWERMGEVVDGFLDMN